MSENIRQRLGREILRFDGAMGTMLQRAGLPGSITPDLANMTHPDMVQAVHAAYVAAGAQIIKTNTFGANALKLKGSGYAVEDVVAQAVSLAQNAGDAPHYTALDIGPSGKLLAPMGDLDFGDAYALFLEVARAGQKAGADLILIETMSDTYELKAAVLAAKVTGLPVFATATVDAKGKLLTGGDMASLCALLSGLRVDALGLNCGFGPDALLESLAALRACTALPLILSPNGGLPRQEGGHTHYDESPAAFASAMERAAQMGASVLGGCCGTTPDHIAAMTEKVRGLTPLAPIAQRATVISSGSRAVSIGGKVPVLIGERINPTGKPAMKRALKEGNEEYMLKEALRQQDAGVHILDVNVGLPGIDESAWLARLVPAIQGICDLPLQLDTANPAALEKAMFRYNGKPLVNSVSGKRESMDAIFPLIAQYGGAVVALTLDEEGIPATAEGRVAIAEKIIGEAACYGISKEDIIIDPLTMAVSAQPDAALTVLNALSRIRRELGVQTVLGVSNVSFGLPKRGALNGAFFTLAAGAGLSAAIMNPFSPEMMGAYHSLSALLGEDPGCAGYIAAMAQQEEATAPIDAAITLHQAIRRGLKTQASQLAGELAKGEAPLAIVERELIPALNEVGRDFEKGRAFLPQLLMAAEAAKAAFEAMSSRLPSGQRGGRGKVILATVHEDIHDIGKNIAKAMLENFRFDVVDLGRSVPKEAILAAVKAHDARLVGLSALMTTTVANMESTIKALRAQCPGVRIMVGGAVLTADYAMQIGADKYLRDAMDTVRYAEETLG